MTVNVTSENFRREVLDSPVPVLLQFYAVWCGKCAMMEDIVSDFAGEHEGRIKVCRADIDNEEYLAAEFGVDTVPTFIAFFSGKAVGTVTGVVPDKILKELFLP